MTPVSNQQPTYAVYRPTGLLVLAIIGLLALNVTACDPPETEIRYAPVEASGEVHEFTLEAHMDGYYGLDGDIEGEKNPTLQVEAGDEVRFVLVNGENMPHDIAMKSHDVESELLRGTGQETTVRFIAQNDDEYYCTIPGHEQAGMVGELEVLRPDDEKSPPRAGLN